MATSSRRRRWGTAAMIVVAILLGLLAAGGAWWSLQRAQKEARAAPTMVDVVTAKADIPARTEIKADMLQVQQVLAADKQLEAVTSPSAAIGRTNKAALNKGQQVLYSNFLPQRKETGLTFVVPPNKRAVSVKVSELIGSGGNILPGDFVDVFGICKATLEKATQPSAGGTVAKFEEVGKAVMVVQDSEVLAVAQLVQGTTEATGPLDTIPRPGGEEKETSKPPVTEPKPQPKATTVTLAVTPIQAERLVLYESLCELRLAIRPGGDHTIATVFPIELHYGVAGP